MSTMVLGSLTLAWAQYDEIRPKALSKAELLELFAVLYDVIMPLAYVKAVEEVFGHIKTTRLAVDESQSQ